MQRKIYLNWHANNRFGWGILGLNIFFHWANDPEVLPLMGMPITEADLQMVDPLRLGSSMAAIGESNRLQAALQKENFSLRQRGITLIDALGNGFAVQQPRMGAVNIGRCIFEDTRLSNLDQTLAKYDALLCASRWNADLLAAHSSKPVKMIHEGIDHSLFFPGPRSGINDPGRFRIFSGGKVEYRKAQDLVLLAFREFSARHDDAQLVTAWHSPWPRLSAGFQGRLSAPLGLDQRGMIDVRRWAAENGIAPDKVLDIGPVPNPVMPMVLREMDCALLPSRAEACTNLPAKEAMACGVPVILAENTGVRDLVGSDNCVPLRNQTPITDLADSGTLGWGESSVDEIVAALELLYTDTQRRRAIGAAGADWILREQRTWQAHAAQLKDFVLSL